jgi:hypothetical protein
MRETENAACQERLMPASRRFPPPWSAEDTGTGSAYVVKGQRRAKSGLMSIMRKSRAGVRRRGHYLTANAFLAMLGIAYKPATPEPHLTIGIACYHWLPNPSFVK